MALVSVETEGTILRRYETGGDHPMLTHECEFGDRTNLAPEVVEEFRTAPPASFRVRAPDPQKPIPPDGTPTASARPAMAA